MSGLDKMKSRIFEEAEQSAAELLDQAKKDAEKIVKDAVDVYKRQVLRRVRECIMVAARQSAILTNQPQRYSAQKKVEKYLQKTERKHAAIICGSRKRR